MADIIDVVSDPKVDSVGTMRDKIRGIVFSQEQIRDSQHMVSMFDDKVAEQETGMETEENGEYLNEQQFSQEAPREQWTEPRQNYLAQVSQVILEEEESNFPLGSLMESTQQV